MKKTILLFAIFPLLFSNCCKDIPDEVTKIEAPTNALYIGNSLLIGFGFGMCATDWEHDYYHYLSTCFKGLEPSYRDTKLSGIPFESAVSHEDQNQWMNEQLIPLLNESIDFVLVQLGDNVNSDEKLAVFELGAKKLLKLIRLKAPKATIVWTGEWYSSAVKQSYIANACSENGSLFIDISDLNTSVNRAKIGDIVTINEDWKMTVTDDGIASHPGNKGMKAIADRILWKLGFLDVSITI